MFVLYVQIHNYPLRFLCDLKLHVSQFLNCNMRIAKNGLYPQEQVLISAKLGNTRIIPKI